MIVPSMTACGSCKKDQVVFAGARFALVAVDQNVFRLGRLLGHERPLHSGWEACAAATAQVGGLHLLDDPLGPLGEALLRGFVAAEFDVFVDVRCALAEAAGDDLDFIGMRDEPRHSLMRPCATAWARYSAKRSRNLFGSQIVVEVVVHLDGGGPAACADALNLFEREDAVGSDALVANAEFFLKAFVNLVGAAQHATDVGADLHVEFAGGLEAQHGVVGGDVANVEFVMPMRCGDLGDDGVGEIADLVLRVEQHGNQRGTRALGISATSASKRAASRGEKMDIVSVLIASSPAPMLRGHIHLFLACFAAQPASFCQLQHSVPSVFAPPDDLRSAALKSSQASAVADRNLFFAQLYRCLPVSIQPVRRGVAAKQGSQRNPKLDCTTVRSRALAVNLPEHNID